MDLPGRKMDKKYKCQQCGSDFRKYSLLLQHQRLLGHKDSFKCSTCQKKFGRKDNLDRHMTRHLNASFYHCQHCGLSFSRPDSLQRHIQEHPQLGQRTKRPIETQVGYGQPKRRKVQVNNKNAHYDLSILKQQYIPKFRTTSTHYQISFKDIEVEELPEILKALKTILQSLIVDLTEFMQSTDLVRMSVQCPQLDFPITIPFLKVSNLSVETFLSEIERVLQSYEQFVLDDTLEIQIIHVEMPTGEGRTRGKYVDLERFLKEKQCILQIRNRDNLCCARALVTAKAHMEKPSGWENIRKGRKLQTDLAVELHRLSNVPIGECGIEEIKKFQSVMTDHQIHVVSKDHLNGIVYHGPEADKKIYLYQHDSHYDVITSMPAFLNRSYFCSKCFCGYSNVENHKCSNVCHLCHKIHDMDIEQWKYCSDCNRNFRSSICFEKHLQQTKSGRSTCKVYYRCKHCDQTINRDMHKRKHACGEVYCKRCRDFYDSGHVCYMKPIECKTIDNKSDDIQEIKKEDESDKFKPLYIFFDFECTQDNYVECNEGFLDDPKTKKCKNCKKTNCGVMEHIPNLCVVQRVCLLCINSDVSAHSECSACGRNEYIFSGESTVDEFCNWMFSEENTGATVMCHNFKGYDSIPILSYLYRNGIVPKVIPNGSKNMSVEVPCCNIRMIDSINFLPVALSELPKMFGFEEMRKGYFPHLFNRKENQSIILDHLPDITFYNPDSMSTDPTKTNNRQAFLDWYQKHRNDSFDLQGELLSYCRSDVDILRRCCLKFRELFMEITSRNEEAGIDPFESCITIASACNLVFRSKFLQPNTLGIIPAHGYRPKDKQSTKALQWIKYEAKKRQVHIQHSQNFGENRINQYKVDGYYEDGKDVKVVLEYHGCFWHGCPKCYSRNTVNPVCEMTMADLFQRTVDKKNYIEALGYQYISKWECDFDNEIKGNDELRDFINSIEIIAPLEPRDAFYGGRTEAFRLYHESSLTETINYYDVTSLYPYINKTGKAVLGHPSIITENFTSIDSYEGLMKCKVLPPRGLDIPILPSKINGKLLFPLCRTCAETSQKTTCRHDENERALTGTWVTDEIKMALTKGYQIANIYEVWHFDHIAQYDPSSKSGGIFTDYINTFLKMKQEASGWPAWCKTENDRQSYLKQYFDKEGILLDYDRIQKNPGLRALAKLMLNSFWGKFGQRSNLLQLEYVTDPDIYFDVLTSDQQEVSGVDFVTDEMIAIRWKFKDNFVESSGKTNVVLAAYTTAQARLKLYGYLDVLGSRAIYADTDSIVFSKNDDERDLPLGDFPGDLTDEVPSNRITHFVTAGPKNYSYRLETPDKNGIQTICKVRGITLNYKNSLSIYFNTIKDMVVNEKQDKITVTDDFKICRDKNRLLTLKQRKDYRIVFDKRVIEANWKTYPYGF